MKTRPNTFRRTTCISWTKLLTGRRTKPGQPAATTESWVVKPMLGAWQFDEAVSGVDIFLPSLHIQHNAH